MIKDKLFVLALAAAGISLFMVYLSFFGEVISTWEVETRLSVGEKVKFNLDTNIVDFGGVTPGGSSAKTLGINNSYEEAVRIRILSEGELKEWMHTDTPDFVLQAHETKEVIVSVAVPRAAEKKSYSGKLVIQYLRIPATESGKGI